MDNSLNFSGFEDFKSTQRELVDESFAGVNPDWQNEPCTQKQIGLVYVLLGDMGYDKDEKEDYADETEFRHMSKGEIGSLIEELKIEAGWKKEEKLKKTSFPVDDDIFNPADIFEGYDLF